MSNVICLSSTLIPHFAITYDVIQPLSGSADLTAAHAACAAPWIRHCHHIRKADKI